MKAQQIIGLLTEIEPYELDIFLVKFIFSLFNWRWEREKLIIFNNKYE